MGSSSGSYGSSTISNTTGTVYNLVMLPGPSPKPGLKPAVEVRPDLQQVITNARPDRFPSRTNVQLWTTEDGSNVVLRGRVASDYERRLTEAMIRLSPDVRQVQNQLEVAP